MQVRPAEMVVLWFLVWLETPICLKSELICKHKKKQETISGHKDQERFRYHSYIVHYFKNFRLENWFLLFKHLSKKNIQRKIGDAHLHLKVKYFFWQNLQCLDFQKYSKTIFQISKNWFPLNFNFWTKILKIEETLSSISTSSYTDRPKPIPNVITQMIDSYLNKNNNLYNIIGKNTNFTYMTAVSKLPSILSSKFFFNLIVEMAKKSMKKAKNYEKKKLK